MRLWKGHPTLTWDYWIDNETYDTVRFVRSGGRTYDYTIEHLKSDQGLRWELDALQFKDEPPAKLLETPFK